MNKPLILDGGMGTMLQNAGMGLGERPDIFGMNNPEILKEIQKKYIDAGSDIIYSNTFGANAHKLRGTGAEVRETVMKNIAVAKEAAGGKARVALDIGPIGELMEPLGTLSFEEAYEIFKEMVEAGAAAGADLVVLETMTDLNEVRAGVLAVKENSDLPVWVTMSFEKNGRTFTGTTVECMASTLDGLGVDAMGINCSLGPAEIYPLMETMRQWTDKPLIVKPNAGLPDPATGTYSMNAEDFGTQMKPFLKLGVSAMGGCCGTTPEFIRAISDIAADTADKGEDDKAADKDCADTVNASANIAESCTRSIRRGICSSMHMTEFGGVKVIGERINPTGKKPFQQALRERNFNYIMECAIEQADAGADILDINVGLPDIDEPEMMTAVIKAVQSVVDLPLQIDSSNPEAIEAGLRACAGRAIVNSVNAEDEKLETILPIVKKYGAAVVGLTMDHRGIPQTAEERFEMAEKILNAALAHGIAREDVLIDCLTLTVSAQQEQAGETLKAVQMVKEKLGLHCVLGVSNISFGLPERMQVTRSFLTQAMAMGLDFPIINPNQVEMMDAIAAFKALNGEDKGCEKYIQRFAADVTEKNAGNGAAKAAGTSQEMTVETAVLKGLKQETADLTAGLLETMSELDVINKKLIPALDVVGEKYEKGQIFLPQLINSANAACAGFDLIKQRIAKRGGDSLSKGKIVMATVEGDIHDIGKNIVRVVLENYGYQVIDLGRDVPVKTVVDAVIREDVRLVGLSALMTTTVDPMKRTIESLRNSGCDVKVMVGGAVLTEEFASQIGADYYVKDAKASVDVAKEVLG